MNYLKKNSDIFEWNKRGVISYHGQKLDQSNLVNFFHFLCECESNIYISSQRQVLHALDEIGMSESIIKNKYLKDLSNIVKLKPVKSPRKIFIKKIFEKEI